MKFLAHGDSVVSLRFIYNGGPEAPNLTIDRQERVISDEDRATAIGKLDEVAILLEQYSEGTTDFGSPDDLAGIGQLLAYFNTFLRGDLHSSELATLEQVEGQYGALAGETPPELTDADLIPSIDQILPSVGTTEELYSLMEDVSPNAAPNFEGGEAVAALTLERADLANSVLKMAQASESGDNVEATKIGFTRDVERTANNQQDTQAIFSVAGKAGGLSSILAAVGEDVTKNLDMSSETLAAQLAAAEAMVA